MWFPSRNKSMTMRECDKKMFMTKIRYRVNQSPEWSPVYENHPLIAINLGLIAAGTISVGDPIRQIWFICPRTNLKYQTFSDLFRRPIIFVLYNWFASLVLLNNLNSAEFHFACEYWRNAVIMVMTVCICTRHFVLSSSSLWEDHLLSFYTDYFDFVFSLKFWTPIKQSQGYVYATERH